jgi:predicted phosphodiesterase
MKKFRIIIATLALITLLNGCKDATFTNQIPSTDKDFLRTDNKFDFIIVSDRTNGLRDDIVSDAVKKTNLLEPDFVISVGDYIQGYTEDTIRLQYEWEEWDSLISPLNMKFFHVPGNHDISNPKMSKIWKDKFGITYYHFVYKNVLFLCLNTEDYVGNVKKSISKEQTDYFLKTLQENENVDWTFVFMHRPVFNQNNKNWKQIETKLQEREFTVFAGHTHKYAYKKVLNNDYIILGTTGGSSNLRGESFGEMDHVTRVSMNNGEPSIINLKLDGILEKELNLPSTQKIIRNEIPKIKFDIKPMFKTTSTQTKYLSYFKISNDSELEVAYSLDLYHHPGYSFELDPVKSILKPKESKIFPWKINKLNNSFTDPIELNITYKIEDTITHTELSETFYYKIKPEPFFEAEIGTKEYKLDGVLDEWGALPYKIEGENLYGAAAYNGNDDISATFGVAATKDSIYIGIKVIDDQILVDPKLSYHQQDAVMILLDGRPISTTSVNKGGYFFPVLYLELYPLNDLDGTSRAYAEAVLHKEVKYVCKATDNGYTAEIALHKSFLEKQGNNYESFRLNIELFDFDNPGWEFKKITWQPDWLTDQNIIGSGTFFIK